MRRTSWSSDWYHSSSDFTREGAGNAPAVKKGGAVTKEETREALLEKMSDPDLEPAVFDELNRRVKLLEEE